MTSSSYSIISVEETRPSYATNVLFDKKEEELFEKESESTETTQEYPISKEDEENFMFF